MVSIRAVTNAAWNTQPKTSMIHAAAYALVLSRLEPRIRFSNTTLPTRSDSACRSDVGFGADWQNAYAAGSALEAGPPRTWTSFAFMHGREEDVARGVGWTPLQSFLPILCYIRSSLLPFLTRAWIPGGVAHFRTMGDAAGQPICHFLAPERDSNPYASCLSLWTSPW